MRAVAVGRIGRRYVAVRASERHALRKAGLRREKPSDECQVCSGEGRWYSEDVDQDFDRNGEIVFTLSSIMTRCDVCDGTGYKPDRGEGRPAGKRYTGPKVGLYTHLLQTPEPPGRCHFGGEGFAPVDPLRVMRDERRDALARRKKLPTYWASAFYGYGQARCVAMRQSPLPDARPKELPPVQGDGSSPP